FAQPPASGQQALGRVCCLPGSFLQETVMARVRWIARTAVVLGLLILAVTARADEAATVKAIEKLGGTVTRGDEIAGKPVVDVNLDSTEVTDADLKGLKELKALQTLVLRRTKVTDTGMKELKQLKSLQTLNLIGTKVTDAGLKELKAVKSLTSLQLFAL